MHFFLGALRLNFLPIGYFFMHLIKFFQKYHQSVSQFESRSGPKFCRALSGSKLFANVVSVGTSRQRVIYRLMIRDFNWASTREKNPVFGVCEQQRRRLVSLHLRRLISALAIRNFETGYKWNVSSLSSL